MPVVSRGQITITDLNDGINGKTYILNILNGVRSVTYDQNGVNPSPSQTAFSCELYEDGVLKTPSSFSWTASGLLSGTSSSSTFTPTCAKSFSNANNSITLEVTYDGQKIKNTIPISITKTGKAGDNAIIAVLSNETHTVPTDSAGNNGNYSGANTTIYIYNGATDDTLNWTISASPSSGITGTLASKTYTVTAMTTDIGYVDLVASRSGYTNITKRFTITKSKQGSIGAAGSSPTAYKLISNTAAIAKNTNNVYTPTKVTFSATSATGSSAPVAYSGRFIISESTDGSSFATKYTSSANESSKVYTPSANIKAIKARLYLAGGTTTLLDEQTVPIVCDGSTGATGPQGPAGPTGPQGPQGEALDTFDGVFSEDVKFWSTSYSSNVTPGDNVQAKTSSTSIYGGKTLKITNDTWLYSKNPISIEDGKVYKFTFRVRQLQNPTDTTKNKVYAGATEFAHDGSRLSVNNGTYFVTSSYSLPVKWISVSGDTAPSTYDPAKDSQYDWVEITKYMSTTAKSAIVYGAEQKFPAISAFTAGTKYIKPMFIVNYSSGNGIAEVDCLNVEDVTSLYEAAKESANKINNNAQEIFDKVTQEGVNQGLFLNNGKVYINGEYINAKNLRVQNTAGDLTFGVDSNGDITIKPNSFSLTPSTTNQNTVVNLLNNNTSPTSTSNGLYLKNGKIYLNATNIETGTLKAELLDANTIISKVNGATTTISGNKIRTGILQANTGGSYLNLDNGTMLLGATTNNNYLQWTGSALNIKGNINATSGKIAGYTINGNQLIGTNVGMSGLSGEGIAFWAGGTSSTAPFKVTHGGVLTATSANITGEINATRGSFSGDIASSATITGGKIVGAILKSSYTTIGDRPPDPPPPDEDGGVGYSVNINPQNDIETMADSNYYDYNYSLEVNGANLKSSVTQTLYGDPSAGFSYNTLNIWGSELRLVSGYSPGMARDNELLITAEKIVMIEGTGGYSAIDVNTDRYIGGRSSVIMELGLTVSNGTTIDNLKVTDSINLPIPLNTVYTPEYDTTATWGEKGFSAHFYTTPGCLKYQPNQWGYLLNFGRSSEVHQIWMSQADGDMLHRGGNQNGWHGSTSGAGTWKTVLDSSNFTNYAISKNASCNKNWNWSGQGGQPNWIWGGNDGTNMYVYNPANFNVAWATGAGYANEWRSTTWSNCYLTTGNGDGASWSTHNTIFRSHWGIGFRDYTDTCRFLIDTRTGNTFAKGYVMASSFPTSSDRRLKEKIAPIDERLENLFMELKPVTYYMIEENDKRKHSGFIAQEVEEAMTNNNISYEEFAGLLKRKNENSNKEDIPTQILNDETDEENIEYSLNYNEFTSLNTHMIQKCLKKIEELEKQIKELQSY